MKIDSKRRINPKLFSSTIPSLSHVLLVPAVSVLSNDVQLSEVVDDLHCSLKPEPIMLSTLFSFRFSLNVSFCKGKKSSKSSRLSLYKLYRNVIYKEKKCRKLIKNIISESKNFKFKIHEMHFIYY